MKWLLVLLAVALVGCRASVPVPVPEQPQLPEVVSLKLSSPAFSDSAPIPSKFTCEGADVSPELRISGVPSGAKSLVLIVDDPDAPSRVWEHWTVVNIPPATAAIAEGFLPNGATQLKNDFGRVEWGGPCPPPGKVHHYQFKLFAIDTLLNLPESAVKSDVEAVMRGHVLAEAVLVGTYRR